MPGPVSTWMGDHLQIGKPSLYLTSQPGQLSLAIPPWVGAMSTSESWDVNKHTARCTSPVPVVWQCKLVSGWRLMKRRSATRKDFTLFMYDTLLYLWSKCAAVIGSNRVTWCKLIWGIDRFTSLPVNTPNEPVNTPITWSQYWLIEVLTGKNGLSKHRVEPLR